MGVTVLLVIMKTIHKNALCVLITVKPVLKLLLMYVLVAK